MDKKTIKYALKNLKHLQNDINDGSFHKLETKDKLTIYIEFKCGRNLQLSDEEIKYQATSYLESELEFIKQS